MTNRYDALVIGTGQAGPSLCRRMAAAGMKVAVVERGLFGGTCVNTGCMRQRPWWRARTPFTWHGARPNTV